MASQIELYAHRYLFDCVLFFLNPVQSYLRKNCTMRMFSEWLTDRKTFVSEIMQALKTLKRDVDSQKLS